MKRPGSWRLSAAEWVSFKGKVQKSTTLHKRQHTFHCHANLETKKKLVHRCGVDQIIGVRSEDKGHKSTQMHCMLLGPCFHLLYWATCCKINTCSNGRFFRATVCVSSNVNSWTETRDVHPTPTPKPVRWFDSTGRTAVTCLPGGGFSALSIKYTNVWSWSPEQRGVVHLWAKAQGGLWDFSRWRGMGRGCCWFQDDAISKSAFVPFIIQLCAIWLETGLSSIVCPCMLACVGQSSERRVTAVPCGLAVSL